MQCLQVEGTIFQSSLIEEAGVSCNKKKRRSQGDGATSDSAEKRVSLGRVTRSISQTQLEKSSAESDVETLVAAPKPSFNFPRKTSDPILCKEIVDDMYKYYREDEVLCSITLLLC